MKISNKENAKFYAEAYKNGEEIGKKETKDKIIKYIKKQNFNGSYANLKKNIINYINEQ